MIRIPFAGGHYEGRSKHINAQECMNFYPEVSDQETKGETTLHATPGLDLIDSTNLGSGPIRAMILHRKDLFVVSGNTLYRFIPSGVSGRIDSSVTPSNEGTINTSAGNVSIASSGAQGGQIVIVDGATLFVWELDSVGQVQTATAANPPSIGSAGHGLQTGNKVTLANFAGGTWSSANGAHSITRTDDDNFTVDNLDASGFGTYTADSGDWDKTHLTSIGRAQNTALTNGSNFSSVGSEDASWSNPCNAAAQDDSRASADFGDGSDADTQDLFVTGLGFSIAANSIVVGIEATVEARHQNITFGGLGIGFITSVVKSGAKQEEEGLDTQGVPTEREGVAVVSVDLVYTVGSQSSLPSGVTLSADDVNSDNFGVCITGVSDAGQAGEVEVDHVQVKIYYTDTGPLTPEFVAWVDNNFLANSGGTGQFFQAAQALNWDPLDFATAERSPDNLSAIVVNHREVWLLGDTSAEPWYFSGEDFPLDPIPNAFSEWGIVAPFSAARAGRSLLWLSRNTEGGGQVVMTQGYNVAPVSTPQIDWIIGKYDVISDATAYTMQISGHLWYVLSFPTAKATWVFDLTTGAWFRWGSGGSKPPSGEGSSQPPSRHRGHVHVFDGLTHFLGDWENGNLYKINVDTFEDNNNPIYRVRTSQRIHGDTFGFTGRTAAKANARNRVSFHAVEIEVNTGADVLGDFTTESEERSRVGLSWSDDNGFTFTDTIWRYVEQTGKEGLRLRWQQLGSSRERIFRLETDTNRDIVIVDANIEATVGGN